MRPPGVRNKTSASVRGAFLDCFEAIGGVRHLQAWAVENPTEFYKLLSKLMGTEIKISGEVVVTTHEKTINWLNSTIDSIALECSVDAPKRSTVVRHDPWKDAAPAVLLDHKATTAESNRPLTAEGILNAK